MTDRQYVIPTVAGMGRGLVNHDDRSKNFMVRTLLRPQLERRDRQWRRTMAYDQGPTPHCVAFTGKGMLNTSKVSAHASWWRRRQYDTTDFYHGAQRHDQWEGEAYDGTSGLGLCRYLSGLGIIGEYRWCFGLDDVLLTIGHVGAVGLGIWWYEGMFSPDASGFLPVVGDQVGGHQVELTGVDVSERSVTITNSWGRGWGKKGRAKLRWEDLDRLLDEGGDAHIILTAHDIARLR